LVIANNLMLGRDLLLKTGMPRSYQLAAQPRTTAKPTFLNCRLASQKTQEFGPERSAMTCLALFSPFLNKFQAKNDFIIISNIIEKLILTFVKTRYHPELDHESMSGHGPATP
jgi:hypothetical protein